MPKMKTKSGAKKRFKVTGSGKLMKQQAGMRHNLEGKSSRRTRRLNQEHGLTIILVTHETDVAAYADRVITLRDGMVVSDQRTGSGRPAVRSTSPSPS